jgi:hypothetical protein
MVENEKVASLLYRFSGYFGNISNYKKLTESRRRCDFLKGFYAIFSIIL